MDWTAFTVVKFQQFLLVFVRIMTILVVMPVFGARQIPAHLKVAFGYLLAMIVFLILKPSEQIPAQLLPYSILIGQQILMGLIIGFASFFVFIAIQLAGQIIDLMMGFGLANIVDPIANIQQTLIGQYFYLLTLLLFVSVNAHHLLLMALVESFRLVPITGFVFHENMIMYFSHMLSEVFVIAFKIGFPAIAVIFLTEVALGFVARMIPQMNVFFVGLPLKIFMGFVGLIISLGVYAYIFPRLFEGMYKHLVSLLRLMH